MEQQLQIVDSNLELAKKWENVERYLARMKETSKWRLQGEFSAGFELLDIDGVKEITRVVSKNDTNTLQKYRNLSMKARKPRDQNIGFFLGESRVEGKIMALLEGGTFVLVEQEVKEFKEWNRSNDSYRGSICLLKKATGFEFLYVSDEKRFGVTTYKCGERNWIYTSETSVVISLSNIMLQIKFEDCKKSAYEIMDAFKYSNSQTLVHIYGENPEDQLAFGGFLNSKNASSISKILKSTKRNRNFVKGREMAVSVKNYEFPCLCLAIQEYLTVAAGFEKLLCQDSLSIDTSEENEKLHSQIIDDLLILQTIVPFCRCESSSRKHPFQANIIATFLSSLKSVQKLEKCSLVYSQLVNRITELKKTVENIFPYEELPEIAIKDKSLNDICSQIFVPAQQHEDDTIFGLKREPCFNITARMCYYLDSAGDFSIFDKLDKVLRVGNMDIFCNISNNINSLYRTMEDDLKNVSHFYSCLFTEDEGKKSQECKNPLVIFGEDRVDKDRLKLFALLIMKKISYCWKVLEEMNEATRVYLNFDLKNWEKLYQFRRSYTEKTESFVVIKNSSDEGDVIQEGAEWHIYHKYQASDFVIGQELGSGTFGQCFIAHHPELGTVAIKEFKWETKEEGKKKEIDMFVKLRDNRNIVKLLGLYYSSSEFYAELPQGIVMEHIERTLEKLIHDHETNYTLEDALKRMTGIANGMAAMHAIGIVHRDLKPANILVTLRGTIRICDFGTAEELEKLKSFHIYGSPRYISPEMLKPDEPINEKTDVYSLAICMWEEIHRLRPHFSISSRNEIYITVLENRRPYINLGTCPRKLAEIVEQAWAQQPERRPSMEELERSITNLFGTLPKGQLQTYLYEDVIQDIL